MTPIQNHDTSELPGTDVPATMQAWTKAEYGTADVLTLTEGPVPVPTDDQVLVEVRATSVNAADWHLTTGSPYLIRLKDGLRAPKSNKTGLDLAGVIVAIGAEVAKWSVGDRVFGEVHGSHADYVVAGMDSVAKIPDGVTYEQAAALPVAGLTALQAIRDKAEVTQGQSLLVIGASGSVGTYVVQLAKEAGADVTAVVSTQNLEMAERLGADRVIDRKAGDFTAMGERFDVVIDVAGLASFPDVRRLVAEDGTYVLIGGPKGDWLGPLPYMMRMMAAGMFSGQTFTGMLAKATQEDLAALAGHLEAGTVVSEVAEVYDWADLPTALARLGEGHAPAKLVVRR